MKALTRPKSAVREIGVMRSRWLNSKRFSNVWLPLLSLLLFVILTALILWPLTAHLATSANNEGDDLQQMWSMGWVMHSLTHDPSNLFNGNIFYPYLNTLAYSDNLIPQALLGLPIYLLTNNLILSYNLVMFGALVLAGWGMFWLVRDLTGSSGAGLVAGTIFAFAPYKIAHLSQLNLLSIEWLPFAFLCLRRLVLADLDFGSGNNQKLFWKRLNTGWGWAVGFGCFFLLQSLSSVYYFLYAIPLYLIYFVGLYIAAKRWPAPTLLIKLGLASLIAILIILPTLIPYLQVSNTQAAERTTLEVNEFAANYRFYLGVPENNLLWGQTLAKYGGSGGERRLFPGLLAYLLAVLAVCGPLIFSLVGRRKSNIAALPLLTKRLSRERYIYLVLGLFALLMSFGFTLHLKGLDIPLPYRFFYDYFPGWKGLRAAVRYGVFVLFAVSVLAGIGFGWLQQGLLPRGTSPRPFYKTGVLKLIDPAILLLVSFLEYRSDITYTRPAVLSQPPPVYSWLGEAGHAGPVLELPMAQGPDLPSIHDFYSSLNWQPTVNGESGYTPPVYSDLYAATQPDRLLSTQTLATLQGMGIRWLVWHLHDESMPLDPTQWQKLQPQLDSSKYLKLAYSTPTDRVYELAPDPWMTKLSNLLPTGAGLYISDFRRQQPMLTELTETILQRDGHALYGNDRAGYRFLKPPTTGQPLLYGLFAANEDPSPYGFKTAEVAWSNDWLKLYKRKEDLLASYDVAHDPILAPYNQVKDELQLRQEVEGIRFADHVFIGGGRRLLGKVQLIITFSSPAAQTITLVQPDGTKQPLNLAPGLTTWRSGPLSIEVAKFSDPVPNEVVKIEPNSGQALYLNRVDVAVWQPTNPTATLSNSRAAILQTSSGQEGQQFVSRFEVYAPNLDQINPTHYNFTLDIYKRPWGSGSSGHFGDWTVALSGQNQPQTVEFRFDPVSRQTSVTVAGKPADVGSQPLDVRDGPYSAYISLWQLDNQKTNAASQWGVSHLYDFSLNSGQISEVAILPEREFIFVPPLK